MDAAGGGVDLFVDQGQAAGVEQGAAVVGDGIDGELAVRLLLAQARKQALRQREREADGLRLRDRQQAVGVARVDPVADIEQARAGAAVERRADARIVELQPRRLELCLVDGERRHELGHEGALVVQRLARDRLACRQAFVAREVDAGGSELRRV